MAGRYGLAPNSVWDLELWEFNNYILGCQTKEKNTAAAAVLTGYYCSYYTNGGKKAKSPSELIERLYAKKQCIEQGLADIKKARELERKIKQTEE